MCWGPETDGIGDGGGDPLALAFSAQRPASESLDRTCRW